MAYEKLFSEGRIGSVTLKNRLVMSPMGIGLANLDGTPTDEMIAYYEARAKGGAGLIIPEITRINDATGAALMRQLAVTKDRHIAPLSKLADAVHKHGSKIFIQLHHPGRQTLSVLLGGAPVVAPSAIPCNISQQETRELPVEEIRQLVQQFIDGAKRVQLAGCDGVELHAAHGYLINQFLSPYSNKRTDEYGGNFENRFRFIREIIEGIHAACPGFPIVVRLSVEEFIDEIGIEDDCIHLSDGVKIAQELEKIGVDAIDVSLGVYDTFDRIIEPISYPLGWRNKYVRAVKEAVSVPVIGVGIIREPEMAESFLADGSQDFISMGRAWLADPDWAVKVQEGREKELCKCINCLRCFETLESFNSAGMPPECAMNPHLAHELHDHELSKDAEGRRVVVVGAGPSGMMAAITAAKRGARVTLMERCDKLGGTVNLAMAPPLKDRMRWMIDYYEYALQQADVDVQLGAEATADSVAAMKPDAVIAATGGISIIPQKLPGVNGKNVYTIDSVLTGKSGLKNQTVIVVGAGLSGLETAEYLCADGNHVTIVDMLDQVAPNAYKVNVADVMGRLMKDNTEILLSHTVKEIRENGIVVHRQSDDKEVFLEASAVVLSLGFRPDTKLAEALREKGIEVHTVGTAVADSTIAPAVRSGYETARDLFLPPNENSFFVPAEKFKKLFAGRKMYDQESIAVHYLTDPAAIARILPPGLAPYPVPVVSVFISKVGSPDFTKPYSEAILGCLAMHGEELGLYGISLLLGGDGAEMATQSGRDVYGFSKKVGASMDIVKDGGKVRAYLDRNGIRLMDIEMELGEFNSPLAYALSNGIAPGATVPGQCFNFKMDAYLDENNDLQFDESKLFSQVLIYHYKEVVPAFASLKLVSSVDDPWGELPINTVIGGVYNTNDLDLGPMRLLETRPGNEIAPYLVKSRYDDSAYLD